MRKLYVLTTLLLAATCFSYLWAQDIALDERASLEQVYQQSHESESLLPFNDLDIEFGYVLYQAEINVETEESELELENVRDYAVILIDGKLQGTITDNRKKVVLNVAPGKYVLQLYAENIGRITYGPEILDNSKGLFGSASLDGEEIEGWTITPLGIKDCLVANLKFEKQDSDRGFPCFRRGVFRIDNPEDKYLDISGWGMGEVWINGKYMGSYWEEEKQQSIQIPASDMRAGENEIVVFEMKNSKENRMKLVDSPLFK